MLRRLATVGVSEPFVLGAGWDPMTGGHWKLGMICVCFVHLKKKMFFIIFHERGREGEREGEKHQCVVAS